VYNACGVLANLAAWSCVNEADTEAAIPLVIAALRTHAASATVALAACEAVDSLAMTAFGKAALLAAGSVPLVRAALTTHAATATVVDAATRALRLLEADGSTGTVISAAPIAAVASDAAVMLECAGGAASAAAAGASDTGCSATCAVAEARGDAAATPSGGAHQKKPNKKATANGRR